MQQLLTNDQRGHTTALNCEYFCSNHTATAPVVKGDWALNDTGASHHMFKTTEFFVNNSLVPNPDISRRLTLAGGDKTLTVHSIGTIELLDVLSGRIELHHALYVPELNKNLIAGGALVKKGVTSIINPTDSKIFSMFCNGRRLFDGFFSVNLMFIRLQSAKASTPVSTVLPYPSPVGFSADAKNSLLLLHKRLGHVNQQYLCRMIDRGCVEGIEKMGGKPFDCIPCIKSKSQSLPFLHTRPCAIDFLQNIHVDLSGIIRNESIHDTSYFILFTDDYSSMRFIYPLSSKRKEHVFPVIESFISYAERQTDRHVKGFTLDCGSEFFNSLFEPYCLEKGIILHATAPYTPEQNGVSERSMKTINGKARAMLLEANVPAHFWYQAAETAVFLHNRTICTASGDLDTTPFELWYKRRPNIHHLRVFGCSAQILIRKPLRGGKFEEVTHDGVLLGFVDDNFNYRVFNLDTNKIIVTHSVFFQENVFPFQTLAPTPTTVEEDTTHEPAPSDIPDIHPPLPDIHEDDDIIPLPSTITDPDITPAEELDPLPDPTPFPPRLTTPATAPPRRTTRESRPVVRFNPSAQSAVLSPRRTASLAQAQTLQHTFWHNSGAFVDQLDEHDAYAFATTPTARLLEEPKTYAQAMLSPNADQWRAACNKEIDMFKKKEVWHLVQRPVDKNVIKGRWVFKVKLKEDGSIYKYKAQYVAKGYSQLEGVDFFETFSPTGKPASFRTFVATAAANGWDIEQMDAVSAFLNCDCEEELYLELPDG